ncbi:hypothetical protein [Pseudooctadecabacter sp.]|uniref:hypothetical protein n=1 Tax=Pseudooctadecabacter sp. TaxID=1966338 RepID=UPI0025E58E0A|nr:hypothetical protein [Pseudooctadecabacter sp.]
MRHVMFGLGAVALLAGCSGDPLGGMTRLQDVSSGPETAAVAAPAQQATGGGLFSRLVNRQADDPTNAAVEAALADAPTPDETVAGLSDTRPAAARGGLFGLFGGNRTGEGAGAANVTEARAPAPPRGLTGLFGGAGRDVPRTGPDSTDVEAGAALPFGQIARVCGMTRSQLGTRIDDGGGFSVYDTNPNLTTARPFYITGFNDNCARTFTGAVAVAGNIQTHEFVRYQPSNERISYTATDNAYEAIKASVCRVGRGQPCGARADRLNRNTYFITAYSFFGGTFSAVPTQWTQILLHDGEVLAASIKNN